MSDRSNRISSHCSAFAAFVLLGAVIISACTSGVSAPEHSEQDKLRANAVVEKVIDGDTISVQSDGDSEKVRLIGVDTPETVDPRKPVMCFGKEASRFTAQLIPPGTRVQLRRDVEARDRYGRLLAYVFRASDALFVNMRLIEGGYADTATFPPNVAFVDQFAYAVRTARQDGRGLWSACEDPFNE